MARAARSTRGVSGGSITRNSLGSTKTRSGGIALSLVWEDDQIPLPTLDAVFLLRRAADAVLIAHRDAILRGEKADGSGAQPRLDPQGEQGSRAKRGERPNIRGNTGSGPGAFPYGLRRSTIKSGKQPKTIFNRTTPKRKRGDPKPPKQGVIGVRATCTIGPSSGGASQWLAREARRGNTFLYVEGDIADLIEATIEDWLDDSFVREPKPEELSEEPVSARDI